MMHLDQIADFIYHAEARIEDGHLAIYHPPKCDGGGEFEVAGITSRHNPFMAQTLRAHIEAGNYNLAEQQAKAFTISYTDPLIVLLGCKQYGPEAFIRDCNYNRGEVGAVKIIQMALDVSRDGHIGPVTKRAYAQNERFPSELLYKLRGARERYEREVVGRNENSPLWNGLKNRWNNAHRMALNLQRMQNSEIFENAN